MQRSPGLTLLELLITLAIVAIIVLAGVPMFRDLQLNQHMTAQVNGLIHAIFLAKHSAHTTLSEMTICKSQSGHQCESQAEWSDGWLLFNNIDRDRPPSIDADENILASGEPYPGGRIHANRLAFVFRAFEIRSTNGTLVFCDARGEAHAKALIVSYTGRPRIANKRADGQSLQCPA